MGFIFTPKLKSKTGNNENWGMGLLLVFFPEDKNDSFLQKNNTLLSSSSSSIRRTNSSALFTKAQSTISICALFVFLTLLLFTLSTFEPSVNIPNSITTPRRFLSQKSPSSNTFSSFLKLPGYFGSDKRNNETTSFALQGMGTLYRRGTIAMSDLVVAHVIEDVKENEFRLFLRLLHRSGLTARADVAFLFGSSSLLLKFSPLIHEENESFLKLVQHYKGSNDTSSKHLVLSFDITQFVKAAKKEMPEPLWGKKIRGNLSNSVEDGDQGESNRVNYGSLVGFEVSELDPENSLAGFLDHVPIGLRRWACYPMLLGRVRRNFKHIALIDVKNMVVVDDPLGRVRNRSLDSVHVTMKQDEKHKKRNSDKTQSHHQANSAIIMGGTRGVRRLSSVVLTEIVRAAMQHKKNSVTESGILNRVVGNEHISKNIDLVTSSESIRYTSSLSGSRSKSSLGSFGLLQRGNSNSNDDVIDSIIMKQICYCEEDSSVYKNC
ncbi:uncharacterized protein LOC123197412 [Mangifera indica]|uniref:uncharacterized protein LOC123197412 n=1 Tax=Mangifera indica TaxID=29780 RepID=UPI001CF96507|nr:uncharacterized protein LOC123197412 [Mangifera indica]